MAEKFKTIFGGAMVCLLVCIFALAAAAQKVRPTVSSQLFKNLAGSAEEIASMRLPSPANLGARSKSAVIPIGAPISEKDYLQEFEIPVDTTENFKLMLLSPLGKNLAVRAAFPGEDFFDLRLESLARNIDYAETTYGLGENQFPAEVFVFSGLKNGLLRVQVEVLNDSITSPDKIGYLVASSDSPYRLYSFIDTHQTVVGRKITFVSALYDQKANSEDEQPQALIGNVSEAKISIRAPNGERFEMNMTDRGNGEFETAFAPRVAGRYQAQIFSKGVTPEGAEFIRSAEHTFEVAPTAAEIKSDLKTILLDDLRWRINLPVSGLKADEKIIAHAEIWGRDADNNELPVAWIGGMALVEKTGRGELTIPLTLDSRWLARNPAAKSFELRNIRLQNPDSSIVLGVAETIPLAEVKATEAAQSFAGTITDDMRRGARPWKISEQAVGGRLMLVHGYCSGDAWGGAASAGQFTNYVKFLDLNRNRSHDQFANLIRNFGASLPSFGIVAHSQGGAAALHLYTYYWSGLDYATGARLIQSVGTPYQGTALAGNLALIGQIFGAGCGSNYDLTYNGAAAWLANIPSWARAKVYYHTTSFSDVWWRYDYCNLATDPFLSDPDDGVVERSRAQLSGAFNLGHKTGWCHTSGMRDPSQTSDAARNTNMNANAAR